MSALLQWMQTTITGFIVIQRLLHFLYLLLKVYGAFLYVNINRCMDIYLQWASEILISLQGKSHWLLAFSQHAAEFYVQLKQLIDWLSDCQKIKCENFPLFISLALVLCFRNSSLHASLAAVGIKLMLSWLQDRLCDHQAMLLPKYWLVHGFVHECCVAWVNLLSIQQPGSGNN